MAEIGLFRPGGDAGYLAYSVMLRFNNITATEVRGFYDRVKKITDQYPAARIFQNGKYWVSVDYPVSEPNFDHLLLAILQAGFSNANFTGWAPPVHKKMEKERLKEKRAMNDYSECYRCGSETLLTKGTPDSKDATYTCQNPECGSEVMPNLLIDFFSIEVPVKQKKKVVAGHYTTRRK